MRRYVFIFIALLFLLPLSSSLCAVGESCEYTRDCEDGYCVDSTCILPTVSAEREVGQCAATLDCSEGYCSEGTCILPTVRSEILEIGIKGGCAGFVEETGAFGSFAICEAIWLLVPVFSLAAAYTSYKRGNERLLTVAFLIFPFFVALLFFAFLGVIVALLELAFIVWRGKGR